MRSMLVRISRRFVAASRSKMSALGKAVENLLRSRSEQDAPAPYTQATWEYPPCDVCGKECIFDDGLCAKCYKYYKECA